MNRLEYTMIDLLKELKADFGVIGVKAEFEAEGTKLEEAVRLKEIITRAGLELNLKIGGCEAVKDLYDVRTIGAKEVVAPMIESPFALKKYLQAVKAIFSDDEYQDMEFLINIETITACNSVDAILEAGFGKGLKGIVIGRGDLAESLDKDRNYVNSPEIFDLASMVLVKAKSKKYKTGLGGGVTSETLDFIRRLPKSALDYYETRKVQFSSAAALLPNAAEGIAKAVDFELLWLKNKKAYYGSLYSQDDLRISALENRYQVSLAASGKQKTGQDSAVSEKLMVGGIFKKPNNLVPAVNS